MVTVESGSITMLWVAAVPSLSFIINILPAVLSDVGIETVLDAVKLCIKTQ